MKSEGTSEERGQEGVGWEWGGSRRGHQWAGGISHVIKGLGNKKCYKIINT